MKVIAVAYDLPIIAENKEGGRYTLSNDLKDILLNTSLRNKSSILKSILEKKHKASSELGSLKLLHRKFHQSLTRDMRDVLFVGVISNLTTAVEPGREHKVIANLRKSYAQNEFYPVSECDAGGCMSRDFGDVRIRNVCHSTQWNDIAITLDDEKSFAEYRRLNQVFCDALVEVYEEGDVVLVMDHCLWMLPQLVREKLPHATICTTILLSFPGADLFQCIGYSLELTQSLLASSYIEFQTKTSLNNFVEFCNLAHDNFSYNKRGRTLRLGNSEARCAVNRYGVSGDAAEKMLKTERCQKYVQRIKAKYRRKKIVVSVTSVASSHTLLNVYKTMEHFFERYGLGAVFINVEVLDGRYDPEVKAEIGRIEEYIRLKYGQSSFKRKVGIQDHQYYGLLSAADCGLLLTENSDVSLPAIDFAATRSCTYFPLIVAENAGFARKLGLTKVNPRDFCATAKKIHRCLNGSQKKRCAKGTFASQSEWLSALEKNIQSVYHTEKKMPSEDVSGMLQRYRDAKSRTLLLDYDGTLTDLVGNPADAKPTESLLALLTNLAAHSKVFIVTGRDRKVIDEWISNPEIEIYAEHGTCHRKGGTWDVLDVDTEWMASAQEIMEFYVERTQGALLEVKQTALCFHYRQCSEIIGRKQAILCRNALNLLFKGFRNVEIIEGKCVVEIRLAGKNKGDIVRSVQGAYDFVMCAGDDRTDESMFSVCTGKEDYFSVVVGKKESAAEFFVDSPEAFVGMLQSLLS